VVVAVEWAHEPVIFEEGLSFALLVHVFEHHFALQKHLVLLDCLLHVARLEVAFAVYELLGVSAFPALQDVFV